MISTRPHRESLLRSLADPVEAAAYLDAVAGEGNVKSMLKALRNVVDAQGGIGGLAQKTRLSRTTLYKTLSASGNPGLWTLDAILGVYDMRVGFQPLVGEKRGAYRAKRKR